MARKQHLINVHTSTSTTAPTGASLYLGEIAVQHTENNPALWIKMGSAQTSTDYEKFIGETEIMTLIEDSKILGSGYTYSGLSYVNSATTIADAYSALTNEVILNEKVGAAAINELNRRVNELSGNTSNVEELINENEEIIAGALNILSNRIGTVETHMTGDYIPLTGYELASGTSEEELGLSEEDTVNEAFGKLQKQMLDNEEAVAAGFNYFRDRLDDIDEEISHNTGVTALSGAVQSLSSATRSLSANVESSLSSLVDDYLPDNYTNTGTTNELSGVVMSISAKTSGVLTLNLNGVEQGQYSPSANTTINLEAIQEITGADVLLTGYELATGSTEADLVVVATDTVNEAFGKLQKQNYDNEAVVAGALNDIDERIYALSGEVVSAITIIDSLSGFSEEISALTIDLEVLSGAVVAKDFVIAQALNSLNDRVETIEENSGLTALSASVIDNKSDISALSASVIDNEEAISGLTVSLIEFSGAMQDTEYVVAQTFNSVNDRLLALEGNSGLTALSASVVTNKDNIASVSGSVIEASAATVAIKTGLDNLSAVTLTGVSLNSTPLTVTNYNVSVPVTTSGSGIASASATGSLADAKAVKEYVEDLVSSSVDYKGATASTPASAVKGDLYIASADFMIGSDKVETGDFIIYNGTGWDIIEKNLDGAITGSLTGNTITLGDSVNSIKSLANGTAGQVLKMGSSAPEWGDLPVLSSATTGAGNVVSSIQVNGHEITYVKDFTAATNADLTSLSASVVDNENNISALSASVVDNKNEISAVTVDVDELSGMVVTIDYVVAQALNNLNDRIDEIEEDSGLTVLSASVVSNKNDVVALSASVVDNNSNVTALSASVVDNANKVVGLSASVVTNETNITSLSASVVDNRGAISAVSIDLIALSGVVEDNELVTAEALISLNNKIDELSGNTGFDGFEEITWSALKTLRDSSGLTPGKQYRITDYNTTTSQEDTQAAGHQFDIIVVADSVNKLNENARAALHSGDAYFSTSGANLNAWEIKYCLDNDTTRFYWAVTGSTGRGVIYYMKDEWNNECSYDFKNIQFKRYDVMGFTLNRGQYYSDLSARVEAWLNSVKNTLPYRFYRGYSDPVSGQDAVDEGYADLLDVDEEEILESGLKYCILDDPEWLGDPGLIASFDDSINFDWFYTFTNRINNLNSDKSLTKECYNNVIKSEDYLRDNIFLNNSLNNGCYNNTLGAFCYNNTFGNNFGHNTFGNSCNSNTFGNSCYNNTFGNECGHNTFGNSCNSNTFGNSCYSNTFGNSYNYNTFGNDCLNNTFGTSCANNTLGNDCLNNTFGTICYSNTFGNTCNSNTFGNGCSYNTFGDSCYQIIFNKEYVQRVIVENGNQFITLTSTQTTSPSLPLRNITIAQGVNNSVTVKTISHNTLNDTFQTTYANDASGNTVAVNIADIAGVATLLSQI